MFCINRPFDNVLLAKHRRQWNGMEWIETISIVTKRIRHTVLDELQIISEASGKKFHVKTCN